MSSGEKGKEEKRKEELRWEVRLQSPGHEGGRVPMSTNVQATRVPVFEYRALPRCCGKRGKADPTGVYGYSSKNNRKRKGLIYMGLEMRCRVVDGSVGWERSTEET